ncbi:MAG: hypothetical protein K8S87_10925 [Planctomycetes bacterium]|nr:hypothetical protein [Planctomycetota bacterium]
MKNVKSLVIILAFLFAFSIVGNVAFASEEPAPAAEDTKKVDEKTDTEKVVDTAKEGVKDVAEGAKKAKEAVEEGGEMGTFIVVIIVFVGAVIILLILFSCCSKKKKPAEEKKK